MSEAQVVMADFFQGAESRCERWMDREGTPLRLDICCFTDRPVNRDRSGWKARVTGEDGSHERLSMDICFRLFDWVQLRMDDKDSPGHAERMTDLLKSIVEAVRRAAFMGADSRHSEFYLLARERNVLGLQVDLANVGSAGPRFSLDKDSEYNEYEPLLAQTVRDKVLAILRPYFISTLDSESLYGAVPVDDPAVVKPQVEWLLSNGYVVRQEPSDAHLTGGFQITGAGLERLKSPSEGRWTRDIWPAAQQVNVVHAGQIVNSQIQQAGTGAVQLAMFDMSRVDELKQAIEALAVRLKELPAQVQQELDPLLTTLSTQLKSPRPRPAIITEAISAVRDVLTGAAGNLLAVALASKWAGLTP
jgi:hypothetical protein